MPWECLTPLSLANKLGIILALSQKTLTLPDRPPGATHCFRRLAVVPSLRAAQVVVKGSDSEAVWPGFTSPAVCLEAGRLTFVPQLSHLENGIGNYEVYVTDMRF